MWTTKAGVHVAIIWLPFNGTQNSIFRLSFKLNFNKIYSSEVKYDFIFDMIVFYLLQIDKVYANCQKSHYCKHFAAAKPI